MCETTTETTVLRVSVCRLPGHEDVPLPDYQSDHAAGMDIHAAVSQPLLIAPGQRVLVPTGFIMAVPVGYEAQIRPRSGLAYKHGLSMPNAPGTIDADYRGEVKVLMVNLGSEPVTITRGMRIAQMLIKPVPRVTWDEVDQLPPTQRGEGGFGHTGQH
ncbi:MAG: dUTP diphosphatase [Phycisphaeraceae bacterium]|nr:dUTP diphosphatase [Phycisphaeraceae bacterium]